MFLPAIAHVPTNAHVKGIWVDITLPEISGECGAVDDVTGVSCTMNPIGSCWHEKLCHRFQSPEGDIEITWPIEGDAPSTAAAA